MNFQRKGKDNRREKGDFTCTYIRRMEAKEQVDDDDNDKDNDED